MSDFPLPTGAPHAATPSRAAPAAPGVGPLVREWRSRRRCSQMDLALDVGVSTRHLSFVETGRSRPSPALLLALADRLDVPLRDRNRLLIAAGYAPRYSERDFSSSSMAGVRATLQRLLDAHHPYPGVVLDRQWNVVLANGAAQRLASIVPPALVTPTMNIFRASLHPEGLAAYTLNFAEWGGYLLRELQRLAEGRGDAAMDALWREVTSYPNVRALRDTAPPVSTEPTLLLPCELEIHGVRLSLFTTLTTFGTPRDVTLDELCVELFYPADAATEAVLRQAG